MHSLINIVSVEEDDIPFIDDIIITKDLCVYQRLDEGKFVNGRFQKNIRIDQPKHLHGAGSIHAHVLGRKGNELVVVIDPALIDLSFEAIIGLEHSHAGYLGFKTMRAGSITSTGPAVTARRVGCTLRTRMP